MACVMRSAICRCSASCWAANADKLGRIDRVGLEQRQRLLHVLAARLPLRLHGGEHAVAHRVDLGALLGAPPWPGSSASSIAADTMRFIMPGPAPRPPPCANAAAPVTSATPATATVGQDRASIQHRVLLAEPIERLQSVRRMHRGYHARVCGM